MSYTDDESNNDNINEYDSRSDSESSFGEEDEKVVVLSKKQKQIIAFQTLVRTAKQHVNNCQFLDFQHDLKSINAAIFKNKWAKKSYHMPKFFVKHMLEIYNKIKQMDAASEKNQKEQRALKALKKNFEKELRHFKQLQIFGKNPTFWKNEDSDLGEMEDNQDIDESEEEGQLFSIQTTAKDKGDGDEANIDKDDVDKERDDSTDSEEDGSGTDDEDEDEWDDVSWGNDSDDKDDKGTDDEHTSSEDDDDRADGDKGGGGGDKTGASGDVTDIYKAFDEETLAKMRHRSFWVKKDKRSKKKVSKQEIRRMQREEKRQAEKEKKGNENEKEEEKKTERKKGKKKNKITKWGVNRIRLLFQSVLIDRGKSSVNRDLIVTRLEELIVQCELHSAEQARLSIMSVLISFYFDTASRKTTGMSGVRWRKTRVLLSQMLQVLRKNISTLRVSNDADIRLILKDEDEKSGKIKDENIEWMMALEEDDNEENNNQNNTGSEEKKEMNKIDVDAGFSVIIDSNKNRKKLDPQYQWIHGNLLSFIKKLSNELWTNLKSLASKPLLYEKRKKNTQLLLSTYKKAVSYFGKLGDTILQSEIEVLTMSAVHADYHEKFDELAWKLKNKNKKSKNKKKKNKKHKMRFKGKECEILNLPLRALIVEKAIFIFQFGTARNQTQAMLYLIYNMALHNRYELCRDLLLMSHLGSSSRIGATNIELQILYNRALASFAVCSFIAGNWYTTMIILQELFSSNRYKILLAQGYTRAPIDHPATTPELIKLEQLQQSRMLAQHFHLNNDLLEAAHLLSSLFCEIPNMMHNTYETQGFIRNAYFRKEWHKYLRRDLRVPAENTKDYILTCGIAMQNGEWLTCKKIIKKLKIFVNSSSSLNNSSDPKKKKKKPVLKHPRYVLKQLYSTIKRECLRCYLYRYGSCYSEISLAKLSDMFDLSIPHCQQFLSKLIITNHSNDIKFASFDELTQCITIHQLPPQPIQRTALEYSDKLSFFIEQNEKLLGIFTRYSSFGGGSKYKSNQKGGDKNFKGGDKKGKWNNKNQNKGANKWGANKSNQNKKNTGGRFNRGSSSSSVQQSNQSDQQNRKFGYKQNNRTQLRSRLIRPQRK